MITPGAGRSLAAEVEEAFCAGVIEHDFSVGALVAQVWQSLSKLRVSDLVNSAEPSSAFVEILEADLTAMGVDVFSMEDVLAFPCSEIDAVIDRIERFEAAFFAAKRSGTGGPHHD